MIQESKGCSARFLEVQRILGNSMVNQSSLWRQKAKAASFAMLSKQEDALLLPLLHCTCPLGRRIAWMDNFRNTQRCEGDRFVPAVAQGGSQRTGMSCNNDLAILSPLKSRHLLLPNLVILLYLCLFGLCFFLNASPYISHFHYFLFISAAFLQPSTPKYLTPKSVLSCWLVVIRSWSSKHPLSAWL